MEGLAVWKTSSVESLSLFGRPWVWGGLTWRHLLGLMAQGFMFRFPCVRTMVDILGRSVTGPGMSGVGLEGRALLLGGASAPQVCTSTDVCKRPLIGPQVLDKRPLIGPQVLDKRPLIGP